MKARLLALLGLLICFVPSVAFANITGYNTPAYCPGGSNYNQAINTPLTQDGVGLALLALTISFDTVAIAFIISRFFPHAGIKNWIQNEYWEIAKTAIIIVTIYSVIAIISSVTYSLVPIGTNSSAPASGVSLAPLISGAENYLCQVNTQTTNTWSMFGILTGGTGFWAAFEVSFYVPIPIPPDLAILDGAWFLPYSNWQVQTGNWHISPYGSIINDFINFVLFPFTSMLLALIDTMPAFAIIGLTFFIPMGLLFRAFPFIRGLGGTLIAIGLGMSVIFPSVLLLFNYQVTALLSSAIPIVQPQYLIPGSAIGQTCDEAINSIAGFSSIPFVGSELTSLTCTFPSYLLEFSGGQTELNFLDSIYYGLHVFDTGAIYFFLNILLNYGAYLVLQLLLLIMDIIIIYSIIDGVARMLGGSIRLQLGGKMRLAS